MMGVASENPAASSVWAAMTVARNTPRVTVTLAKAPLGPERNCHEGRLAEPPSAMRSRDA